MFDLTTEQEVNPQPKNFETKATTLSSKLKDKVRVKEKEKPLIISLDHDKIKLKKGEYVKLIGITSTERTQLYCSNNNYSYLLELTNNLDFIATSILGGDLDKMLLITEEKEKEEKCQFYEKNNIIYLVYGKFPDKIGKWILEQMSNNFSELIPGKDVEKLDRFEKYEIGIEFKKRIYFILNEYANKLQEVFTDQEIPYVEDTIRIDYLGLSSMSIGVISLLIGEENLNFESLGEFENPEEEKEMKESMLTAKIEAIAANTQGNTGATPRWIAVKLGFQKYRFLTFKKYKNDYFLSMLTEGNLGKIEKVEQLLDPKIDQITTMVFSGNLKPFNELKITLAENFSKRKKFPPFNFN
ncbi:MAG: hypothetical protein JSV23_10935 [Promethearchaeota archaeon]|nr:MAG: hypothetical protein JSV23_10935 [Candidatus Lokiarchaeota archaeon]